jgi:hypothetical protein
MTNSTSMFHTTDVSNTLRDPQITPDAKKTNSVYRAPMRFLWDAH